jgi:hypothetical protein
MDGRPHTLPALAIRYLRYYLFAQSGKGHGIHSPFVYDFVRQVLMDRNWHPDFDQVEKLRSALVKDSRTIKLTDYGAGSGKGLQQKKSIPQIVRSAAKPPRLAQLLYRSVQYFKACTIVELGTSLGLTTAYLAEARMQGNVYSMEGDPAIAAIAIENLPMLKLLLAILMIPCNLCLTAWARQTWYILMVTTGWNPPCGILNRPLEVQGNIP